MNPTPVFKQSQRRLLWELTKRDYQTKYLGSIMGSYWNIIHPLVMIIIYTVIFSKIMNARLGSQFNIPYAYSLYLCSALLPWHLTNEIIGRCTSILWDQKEFIKKLAFPPALLFQASTASALTNFAITFCLFSLLLFSVHPPTLMLFLQYICAVGLFATFAFGLGKTLGCLNVFTKDIQQLTTVVLQLWFWFTPIIYQEKMVPEWALPFLYANPAYWYVKAFHNLLFFHQPLDIQTLLFMSLWACAFLLISHFTYKKSFKYIQDYL